MKILSNYDIAVNLLKIIKENKQEVPKQNKKVLENIKLGNSQDVFVKKGSK